MDNTSQCSRGIPNKSDSEQKQDNFYYSSPKAATDMGVSSSESHDLTAFYEMLSASFGVLSQNTGFYPSLDRIIETTLGPLNLGPGGGSYNEPISCLHWIVLQWNSSDSPIIRQESKLLTASDTLYPTTPRILLCDGRISAVQRFRIPHTQLNVCFTID